MKKFISGLVIGTMVASITPVIASTVTKNLQAHYTVKSLIVNGVNTGKGGEAFVVDGQTYVPLRTVSDALGNDISWDPATKSINITSGSNSSTGNPTDLPIINNNIPTTPNVIPNTPNVVPNANTIFNGMKIISEQQAKDIALKSVGGGTIIYTHADLYDQDDIPDYEIKIRNGYRIYEVEVNALTGIVTDVDLD